MNRIEILLKQYGPMLSGDLAKKYEKNTTLVMRPQGKQYHAPAHLFKKLNIFLLKRIKSFAIWKNNIIHLVTKKLYILR